MKRPPALSRRAAAEAPSPEAERQVDALNRCGLRWGENPEGYRRRLQNLCRFLQEVKGGAEGPAEGDSRRIASAAERANRGRNDRETAARLRRLEDLEPPLRELAEECERARKQGDDGGWVTACLERLADWSVQPYLGETPADFSRRKSALRRPLELVGAPGGIDFGPAPGPLDHLRALGAELGALAAARPRRDLAAAWQGLRERLEDCLADWDWAYVQVLVELARLHEETAPNTGAGGRTALRRAHGFLAKALARLERDDFHQARELGLYGRMARVCLRRVAAGEKTALLQEALGHAYLGIELDPESAVARLALVEVLAALGDFDTMKMQAEVARDLDPGPETLKVAGASFWQRLVTLRDGAARRQLLGDAAAFFEAALRDLESAPFDHESPMRLMDSRGWAHFWLGRLQIERARHDDAIAHLRIACRLGFKPLESRVELAWACLLARDPRQAERAFADAAGKILSARTGVVVSTDRGEEREIDELDFDVCLGWALLSADWSPARFDDRLKAARDLLRTISRPHKDDLEAALREAQGRADFRAGRLSQAITVLKGVVETNPRPGAYCFLGLAEAESARYAKGKEREAALRHAKTARDLAEEFDLRERYRREIEELDAAITQLEPAPPAAATAHA